MATFARHYSERGFPMYRGISVESFEERELTPEERNRITDVLCQKIQSITYDVEVERKNPNSPLFFVRNFNELKLRPELLKGIYNMGYKSPSRIQETALPTLLAEPPQNMIAQSQNGTGKTAAFILTCLSRLNPHLRAPQIIILSPTYELAIQTGSVAEKMARFCEGITFCYAVRGVMPSKNKCITDQVIIGTPGKILDWLTRYNCLSFKDVTVFVLDEADVMIDIRGHHDQSIRIHKKVPQHAQMLLFSATYTDDVVEFAELIVPNPITIRLKREEETLRNIKQYYIECGNLEDKFEALINLYSVLSIGQSIIFCQTRRAAMWLSTKMSIEGHAVALLSGDLDVDQRLAILTRFRSGKERVLITTNVCSRGIDVEQVTLVANFNMPVRRDGRADYEAYLHRIGRSGRFGKVGFAVNMIDGPEAKLTMRQIEAHFKHTITKLNTDDCEQLDKISKM